MHNWYVLAEELENLILGGKSFDDALAEVKQKHNLDANKESDLLSVYDALFGSPDYG